MSEEKQELTSVDNEAKSKYYLPVIPQVEKEKIAQYLMDKHIVKGGLTKDEVEHATELCLALNLDPIKKQIYFVAYGEGKYRTFAPIAAYTTYISRGQQTRLLNGFETTIEEKDGQVYSATCTIYRKDWERPFTSTVYYSELVKMKDVYVNKKKTGEKVVTEFWQKMPRKMLSKCAVVDAFRMCFAGCQELEGLPYIQEELDGEFIDVPNHKAPKVIKEKKVDVEAWEKFVKSKGLKINCLDKIAFDFCAEIGIELIPFKDLAHTAESVKFIGDCVKTLAELNDATV